MPGGLGAGFQSISDAAGSPAVAIVTANARVQTASGFVGLVSDMVQFSGATSTFGTWTAGATRMTINGTPAINASAIGLCTLVTSTGPVPSGPMRVAVPDSRAQGT